MHPAQVREARTGREVEVQRREPHRRGLPLHGHPQLEHRVVGCPRVGIPFTVNHDRVEQPLGRGGVREAGIVIDDRLGQRGRALVVDAAAPNMEWQMPAADPVAAGFVVQIIERVVPTQAAKRGLCGRVPPERAGNDRGGGGGPACFLAVEIQRRARAVTGQRDVPPLVTERLGRREPSMAGRLPTTSVAATITRSLIWFSVHATAMAAGHSAGNPGAVPMRTRQATLRIRQPAARWHGLPTARTWPPATAVFPFPPSKMVTRV